MKRIFITGPKKLLLQLEDRLRKNFKVDLVFSDDNICKIEAEKNNQHIVVCSFTSDENIKNILTMFEINYLRKIGKIISKGK
ncbi:MAG: hypothetical protein ACE5SW_07965 [Nitrososphaeraceae archaeon]